MCLSSSEDTMFKTIQRFQGHPFYTYGSLYSICGKLYQKNIIIQRQMKEL